MPERSNCDHRREGGAWLAVFFGLVLLYEVVLGWQGWMRLSAVAVALASTGVLMFVTGFARGFLRDTWPAVPPDLAEKVVQLRAGGWSTDRVHRWWECDEERPHVHMTHQGDGGTLILVWDGTLILDDRGNVVRREP